MRIEAIGNTDGALWTIAEPMLVRPPAPDIGVRALEALPGPVAASRDEVPAVVPAESSEGGMIVLLAQYDWPVDEAARVMRGPCRNSSNQTGESGGDPSAENGDNIGLFQINVAAHPQYTREQMLDPEQNVAAAYAIWSDNGGWGPWSCKP